MESSIHGYDEKFELDPACMGAALDMIAVLDEGEWVGPMTDTEEYLAIVDGAQWGLVLSLGEFRLRLTLYEAGYARVMGTPGMRLLKFDAERVMPFFELLASGLHGAPVESTRSSGHIRNEALYDEPTYGKYFPQKLPEGYEVDRAFIQYPVNELTGEVIPGGARSLSAEYRGTEDWNKSFEILVCGIGYCEYCAPSYEAFLKFIETCPDEYVNWYFHIDDLTAGSVRESEGYRELSVYDENVMIRITSSSLTPEQMVTLMHECFGK